MSNKTTLRSTALKVTEGKNGLQCVPNEGNKDVRDGKSILVAECFLNFLTPNDPYIGRTAPLTSKCCILYIYSTNTGTEYFKHALYSPFLPLQNAVCFIMLTCLVPV